MGLKKSSKSIEERLGRVPPEDARLVEKPSSPQQDTVTQASKNTKPPVNLEKRTISVSSKNTTTPKRPIELLIRIPLPASGVSKMFDHIASQDSESKAMGAVLTRALDEYEEMLLNNNPEPCQPEYTETDILFTTKRKLNAKAFEIARKHFDPYEYKKPFAMATVIVKTALAAYFSKPDV